MADIKPPNLGPFSPSELWPVIWVTLISLLGGVGSYVRRWKEEHVTTFNLLEFIGELAISALVGLITYWACAGLELNGYWTAALVGICSHMGTRAMALFEAWLKRRVDAYIDSAGGPK